MIRLSSEILFTHIGTPGPLQSAEPVARVFDLEVG